MQFCLSISRQGRVASRHSRALASSASSAAAPTSPPPAVSPSVPVDPKFNRNKDDKKLLNHSGKESIYKLGKHRSNAMELVHKIPPIEVDGEMAICDGGGGALGHPLEYISLQRPGAVEYCKYCALRYTQKKK